MTFLRNSWYCAGWSSELDGGPLGRRILGDYLVIYRSEAGDAIAMTGRCPHRFAPLDRGVVVADTIECPYHGLRFASDGQCVLNPHGGPIPPQAKLRAYPVVERRGVLWIWMGEEALVNPDDLPEDGWLASPAFAVQKTYLNVSGNYQLVVDNLLDLTHVQYLHRTTLGAPPEETGVLEHDYGLKGEVVHSNYFFPHTACPPNLRSMFPHDYGEISAGMQWRPAATLNLDVRIRTAEQQDEAILMSAHYLTPETDDTTHYFAAVGRNRKLDDEAEDRAMIAAVNKAFQTEDEPMIQACHALMGTTDLLSLRPAILATDAPGILARRRLAKRIKLEATPGERDRDGDERPPERETAAVRVSAVSV